MNYNLHKGVYASEIIIGTVVIWIILPVLKSQQLDHTAQDFLDSLYFES